MSSNKECCFELTNNQLGWPKNFQIPWNLASRSFIDDCKNKKIPKKNELNQFNKLLVDSILNTVQRPSRKLLTIIANKLCTTYPESFQDLRL